MDCQKYPHEAYVWILHSSTVISLPLYTVAIVGLLRIKSTYFATYKHFLVWHTTINLLAEIYNSWFLLPTVHLPYPLLRMAGLMTSFGFNGLLQFYVINSLIYQTAYSILEMFMFRFRASLFSYKTTFFYIYLRINIYTFRLMFIAFVILATSTYSYEIDRQLEYRQDIFFNNPSAPLEILCPSVVIAAPLSDFVAMGNLAVWMLAILITFSVTITTTIYLNKYLRDSEHHSAAVLRMQKMLLTTLFVQTMIHAVMLGAPNVLFVQAAFFGAHNETIANCAFVCLTCHGFFATLAMVVFTRPIRLSIVRMFRCSRQVQVESTLYSENKI